ncbi:DNA-3-methyladenine glycosylase [Legionella israelensis]|uniref:DNA-3-methyladenine glycosylase n=1 Tax=Legionella israelensis TaxID=454 RepID=UPI00117CA0D7|nr:DNA-3-methyladenine glycosylase [Legionella israelensis]QDP73380.1 DNA-3-methyladenine glycosylase [Legionella israelensis]
MQKLTREFYARDTETVAQELLGKYLVRRHNSIEQIGRIVEVEAYLGQHDLACHSSKGLTQRTKTMFGPAGYAYIYLIYGMYYCTNVVTESEGVGSAVLLRAVEPVKNISDKTHGPGLLSRAMSIDKTLNNHDMTSEHFYIAVAEDKSSFLIQKKPRIGVAYAKEWANKELRFYIKNNPYVSKK